MYLSKNATIVTSLVLTENLINIDQQSISIIHCVGNVVVVVFDLIYVFNKSSWQHAFIEGTAMRHYIFIHIFHHWKQIFCIIFNIHIKYYHVPNAETYKYVEICSNNISFTYRFQYLCCCYRMNNRSVQRKCNSIIQSLTQCFWYLLFSVSVWNWSTDPDDDVLCL